MNLEKAQLRELFLGTELQGRERRRNYWNQATR